MAFEIVTLDEAKTHLEIPLADTTQDVRVNRFIGEASDEIEEFIDRFVIKRTGIQEFQDGRHNNRILLRQYPAEKPTELRIDASSEFTDPTTLVDPGDYEIDSLGNEVILIHRMFPRGTRNIKIVYDGGIAADIASVPRSLHGACLWIIEWLFDIRGSRRLTQKTVSKGNERTTIRDDWPDWLMRRLDRYKRGPFDFVANLAVQNR